MNLSPFLKALTNIKELQGYKVPVDEEGFKVTFDCPEQNKLACYLGARPRPPPAFLHASTIIHFPPLDPQGIFLHDLSIQ